MWSSWFEMSTNMLTVHGHAWLLPCVDSVSVPTKSHMTAVANCVYILVIVHVCYLEPSVCSIRWNGTYIVHISCEKVVELLTYRRKCRAVMFTQSKIPSLQMQYTIWDALCIMRLGFNVFGMTTWSLSVHNHMTSKRICSQNVLYDQQMQCIFPSRFV